MSLDRLSSLNIMDANAVIHYINTELNKLICIVGVSEDFIDFNTNFSAGRVPAIPLYDFVKRIVNYSPCSLEAIFVFLVIIKRLKLYNGPLFINQYTIHRIVIVGILIATKYQDDIFYNNKFYARIGGVSVREINKLEIEFLSRVRFDLYVGEKEEEASLKRFRDLLLS